MRIIILALCLFFSGVFSVEATVEYVDGEGIYKTFGETYGNTEENTNTQTQTAPTNFTPITNFPESVNIPPNHTISCEGLLGCEEISEVKPGVQKSFVWKDLIPYFIKKALEIGSGIAVVLLVYGGIRYIIFAGDDKERGKNIPLILYTLIGLIVMLLSRAIVSIIANLPL